MKTWDITSPAGKSYVINAPEGTAEAAVLDYAKANDERWEDGGNYTMPAPAKAVVPSGMRTWDVNSPDGQSWTVNAPKSMTESEVMEYAQNHAQTWKDGGTYTVDRRTPRTKQADETAASLAGVQEQIRDAMVTRTFADPVPTLLGGSGKGEPGAVTGMNIGSYTPEGRLRRQQLTAAHDELGRERAKLLVGSTGETVGGIAGTLAGAGTGALVGQAIIPIPGVGAVIGAAVGGLLGGVGGVAAGTHLYDIPTARDARDISEAEAAELIKSRAIESAIWDGAFTVLFGPGGRVLGKMAKGARMQPAIKAAAQESASFDSLIRSKEKQLERVVGERAAEAPEGIATQASTALGIAPASTDKEATRALVQDIAERSGGRVPTQGEMTGVVGAQEGRTRTAAPVAFAKNDVMLADTALAIRKEALKDLDQAGAYVSFDLGNAVQQVQKSAREGLRREAGPVFQEAADAKVAIDMRGPLLYIEKTLFRDAESAGSLLSSDESKRLTRLKNALNEEPFMTAQGAQDFVSGQKDALRGIAEDGTKPGVFMGKALGELIEIADGSFMDSIRKVEPGLASRLKAARKLYSDSMDDLYSDTMAAAARKNPEDVGKALTSVGSITEIRELRNALERAERLSSRKARFVAGKPAPVELGAAKTKAMRKKIDAGLIRGFIAAHSGSIEGLTEKMLQPASGFRDTLKELLTGPGVADRALGRKVLAELDRTIGVMQLIKPEAAPRPGRIGVQGVGGTVGLATMGAAATGTIKTGAPLAVGLLQSVNLYRKALATAMTTGNTGVFRQIQRAIALSGPAGKSPAAAEALRATLNELEEWNSTTSEGPAAKGVRESINAELPQGAPKQGTVPYSMGTRG